MNWALFFYFPLACLLASALGVWTLRLRPKLRSKPLWICRWALLGFPFALLVVSLSKDIGPSIWMRGAQPLKGRMFILPALAGLILLRWVGEMSARKAFLQVELGPDLVRKMGPRLLMRLRFNELWDGLALSSRRARRPPPAIYLSKVATIAHLSGGFNPRICLEASLVPCRNRRKDPWWASVPPPPDLPLKVLRAAIAHELGHFKHRDQLRKLLLHFQGMLLPWEWICGKVSLRKFHYTNTWLFRKWSSLMVWIGTPFRLWILEDQAISEALADEEAGRLVFRGECLLASLRALYPRPEEEVIRPFPAGGGPPWVRQLMLLGCLLALFWGAPGRAAYAQLFGFGWLYSRFPQGWHFLQSTAAEATAIFLPDKSRGGRILVRTGRMPSGLPHFLRCLGRIPPGRLPMHSILEVDWDVWYSGDGWLTGEEAVLSLTEGAVSYRPCLNSYTVYTKAAEESQGPPSRGWRSFRLRACLKGDHDLEYLLLMFELSQHGTYELKAPRIAIVLPDGRRESLAALLGSPLLDPSNERGTDRIIGTSQQGRNVTPGDACQIY